MLPELNPANQVVVDGELPRGDEPEDEKKPGDPKKEDPKPVLKVGDPAPPENEPGDIPPKASIGRDHKLWGISIFRKVSGK
jgi:hypothetical protein